MDVYKLIIFKTDEDFVPVWVLIITIRRIIEVEHEEYSLPSSNFHVTKKGKKKVTDDNCGSTGGWGGEINGLLSVTTSHVVAQACPVMTALVHNFCQKRIK